MGGAPERGHAEAGLPRLVMVEQHTQLQVIPPKPPQDRDGHATDMFLAFVPLRPSAREQRQSNFPLLLAVHLAMFETPGLQTAVRGIFQSISSLLLYLLLICQTE